MATVDNSGPGPGLVDPAVGALIDTVFCCQCETRSVHVIIGAAPDAPGAYLGECVHCQEPALIDRLLVHS
jgi:hypothetical protein